MKGFGIIAVLVLGSIAAYAVVQIHKLKDITVELASKRIISSGLNRIIAELTLLITNDSDIDINVDSYNLDLTVNGNFVSKVQQRIPQLIKKHGKSNFIVMLDFNPKTVVKQALNVDFLAALFKNKSNIVIGLKGYVTILGLKNIAVDISSPLSELT
jgi:hypothetical protein